MSISRVIKDWLADYKTLPDEEIDAFAGSLRYNDELKASLYSLFESVPSPDVLEPVCHQLFEFYRSKKDELKRFTLEFVPTLVWLYLSSLSLNGKKSCGGLEAFLLAVYNLEIVSSDGKPKLKTFRIPSFAQPSVYHEPSALSSISLTEISLSRYNQTEAETWQSGPYPQYESINGQNRQSVLSYILQCYNGDIANLLPSSHEMLCKSCSRIMTSGFVDLFDDSDEHPSAHFHLHDDDHRDGLERRKSQVGELPPRIAVSPAMMIEMLTGLYYIMYNTNSSLGLQAIMNIHKRASYELYADVLLVTNAIRNTLQNLSGQLGEVPMGISVSLTPATSGHMISKSAITNASFRTKKLPDDIQIIPSGDDSQTKLPTIEEDSDTPGKPVSKSSSIIGKLGKRLEKTKKDMKKDTEQNAVVSSITNGDTVDSVQVGVMKNNTRVIVDNVELQTLSENNTPSEKGGNSPFRGKHKSSGIANEKTKELKHKHGLTHNSSGASVNSESYSTDL